MNFDRFDQFEAYTNNTLPDPERRQIEQQLATDAVLRAELTNYQTFRYSLESIPLKHQLEKIHTELDQQGALTHPPLSESPGRVRQLWPVWAAAAMMLVVAGFGLYRFTRTTVAEQTFETYYHPEPVARGATDCGPELTPCIQAYRAGNYSRAYSEVEKLAVDKPCVGYYRGLTQLALGNSSVASIELEKAVATPPVETNLTYQKAEWYLAMAYLKANKPEQAYQQLQKIRNQPSHPFRNEAQKVLRDLGHA